MFTERVLGGRWKNYFTLLVPWTNHSLSLLCPLHLSDLAAEVFFLYIDYYLTFLTGFEIRYGKGYVLLVSDLGICDALKRDCRSNVRHCNNFGISVDVLEVVNR